jgi:5-methylcytosine-specific restriction endonuclease McrA
MDIKMKKCKECGKEKPTTLEFFAKAYVKKDGAISLRADCRKCQSKRTAAQNKTSLARIAWVESEAGKESGRNRSARWRKSEKGKAYLNSEHGKMNSRLGSSRRRARIKQNGVENFSYEDLRIFWLGQNILDDRCYYCLKSLPDGPEHIDHYIPVAKGGSHTKVNLRPSCACCNLKKNDKHPLDFIKEIK